MSEMIILVDENDREIGVDEKLKVHKEGKLHRAFSIFIFNSKGQMLLQKRARDKYHSAGLWSNACCSHPRAGESLEQAVHRRLKEEMGFDCGLEKVFHFTYKAEVGNGLIEHEVDHVFIGIYDGEVYPNPEEAEEFKWVDIDTLRKELKENPDKFTPWFRICVDKVLEIYTKKYLTG
jgi:isopentenyl-diphosphate delta-isomerase